MKKIDFKDKKTLIWRIVGLLVILLIGFLVYKGLEGKSLKIWDGNGEKLVDIANSEDYAKFEGNRTVNFEGENILDFSFLYKKDGKAIQGTGNQANWFKVFDVDGNNYVTLYITFEGGRGYTVDDYIDNVFKKANPDVVIEEVKMAGNDNIVIKHVTDDTINTEYYIQAVTGKNNSAWLAIVENKKADEEVYKAAAKDLVRSFEVVSEVETEVEAETEVAE